MFKKNLSVIMVVLLTLLLIVLVIWLYEKKMQEINKRMHQPLAIESKPWESHYSFKF